MLGRNWVELGVDGGWMPLPTYPQQYYDPASLVLKMVPNQLENCAMARSKTFFAKEKYFCQAIYNYDFSGHSANVLCTQPCSQYQHLSIGKWVSSNSSNLLTNYIILNL